MIIDRLHCFLCLEVIFYSHLLELAVSNHHPVQWICSSRARFISPAHQHRRES